MIWDGLSPAWMVVAVDGKQEDLEEDDQLRVWLQVCEYVLIMS